MILTSQMTDVYRNLAAEEWLLDHAPSLPLLFLYRNAPCVVIGKNQNPWLECRLARMRHDGVPLARRISGGGTVYHDEGNLNFCVITSRTRYREELQYELIFRTLAQFGIRAERFNKSSLAVNGLKFSGQAFCFRGQHALHHGTLLVQTDLNRLQRYLGPDIEGIETRAIPSIPWSVMNLSDTAPGLTAEHLANALASEFLRSYHPSTLPPGGAPPATQAVEEWIPEDSLARRAEKAAAAPWLFERTPSFSVRTPRGALHVVKGRLANQDNHPFSEWIEPSRK